MQKWLNRSESFEENLVMRNLWVFEGKVGKGESGEMVIGGWVVLRREKVWCLYSDLRDPQSESGILYL